MVAPSNSPSATVRRKNPGRAARPPPPKVKTPKARPPRKRARRASPPVDLDNVDDQEENAPPQEEDSDDIGEPLRRATRPQRFENDASSGSEDSRDSSNGVRRRGGGPLIDLTYPVGRQQPARVPAAIPRAVVRRRTSSLPPSPSPTVERADSPPEAVAAYANYRERNLASLYGARASPQQPPPAAAPPPTADTAPDADFNGFFALLRRDAVPPRPPAAAAPAPVPTPTPAPTTAPAPDGIVLSAPQRSQHVLPIDPNRIPPRPVLPTPAAVAAAPRPAGPPAQAEETQRRLVIQQVNQTASGGSVSTTRPSPAGVLPTSAVSVPAAAPLPATAPTRLAPAGPLAARPNPQLPCPASVPVAPKPTPAPARDVDAGYLYCLDRDTAELLAEADPPVECQVCLEDVGGDTSCSRCLFCAQVIGCSPCVLQWVKTKLAAAPGPRVVKETPSCPNCRATWTGQQLEGPEAPPGRRKRAMIY